MRRFVAGYLLNLLLMSAVSAGTGLVVNPMVFKNQWGEKVFLNAQVRWVIYVDSRKAMAKVNQVFSYLHINRSLMLKKHILYIANFSGTPRFLINWVAVPKMKHYAYAVALAWQNQKFETWPVVKNSVTLLELNDYHVLKRSVFLNRLDLQKWIQGKMLN